MKLRKTLFIVVVMFILSLFLPAFAEETESFSFRNGIMFGMNKDQIIAIEEEKNEIPSESWKTNEFENWLGLTPESRVPVGRYNAVLTYMLTDEQMEVAAYDFYTYNDAVFEETFNYLSELYGSSTETSSADIVKLLDCFAPGFTESDIAHGLSWKVSNGDILLFYYNPSSFLIIFTNSEWDYYSPAE